jgi:endonuclease/exonuclease/phosphatase family metal-dependent hydrolase
VNPDPRNPRQEGSGPRRLFRPSGWLILLAGLLLVLAWVLSASRPGMAAMGCPRDCATVAERREGPLRVMSLNVLHGFPRFERLPERLDLIAREIRSHDADIVCLQEVPWTRAEGNAAEHLARLTGLNQVYLRANGNRRTIFFEEGEAILSRFPLHDPVFVELAPRAGFFEHRVALQATAATPWGDLRVVVTHLTHGEPEVNRGQAGSLQAFVEAAGDGPAVIAGDLNAVEDSPQIQALSGNWIDAYRTANPGDPGPTCCIDDLHAGPGEPLEKRLDYVFLAPQTGHGIRVRRAQRVLDRPAQVLEGWQWASDHVGLLVHVEWD